MNRIREIRKMRGIKQKELAQAAGVSAAYIFDLENGRRGGKKSTLACIAGILNVSVDEMMRGTESDGNNAGC